MKSLQADSSGQSFKKYLDDAIRRVDRALRKNLPSERLYPVTLHEAMRYSIFAGGKRMRPVLCLAAAEAFHPDDSIALAPACAVECVHTYSLIHDDLPCMDDDDLRRGMPTSHKKFGEGIAVLAGDALLTVAFEILAGMEGTSRYPASVLVSELAKAAGSRLLIAGQVADLEAAGHQVTSHQLRRIHQGKTAAMISVSLRLGAMAANAPEEGVSAVGAFGEHLGLAFQVIDDILDVTQTSEILGKSAGKDLRDEKSTYPALLGIEASRREAARLTKLAHRALDPLGDSAFRLRQIAEYLLERTY